MTRIQFTLSMIAVYFLAAAVAGSVAAWWSYDRAEKTACIFVNSRLSCQIDSLNHRADSLRRVVMAQEQFFDRFLAGHWDYLPAFQACKSSFRGYVALNAGHASEEQLGYSAAQIDSTYRAAKLTTSVNVSYLPRP